MTLDKHQSPALRTVRGGIARPSAGAYARYTGSHATPGVHQSAAGSFGS